MLDKYLQYYYAAGIVGVAWLILTPIALRYLCYRRMRAIGCTVCRRPLALLSKDAVRTYRLVPPTDSSSHCGRRWACASRGWC